MSKIGGFLKQSSVVIGTKTNKNKIANAKMSIEILLLGLVVFSIYLFISLLSFDPADPSWSQTSMHEPIHNWGGALGAYLSDILLQFFGFAAYSTPFILFVLYLQLACYFYRDYHNPINYFSISLRIIGLLSFIFSITGFFALNIIDWEQYQSGGILGTLIALELYPIFSHIGASLILLALMMASITLLTSYSWLLIAEYLGATIVWMATVSFRAIMRLLGLDNGTYSNPYASSSYQQVQNDQIHQTMDDREVKKKVFSHQDGLYVTDNSVDVQHPSTMSTTLMDQPLNEFPKFDSKYHIINTDDSSTYRVQSIKNNTSSSKVYDYPIMSQMEECAMGRSSSSLIAQEKFASHGEITINPEYHQPLSKVKQAVLTDNDWLNACSASELKTVVDCDSILNNNNFEPTLNLPNDVLFDAYKQDDELKPREQAIPIANLVEDELDTTHSIVVRSQIDPHIEQTYRENTIKREQKLGLSLSTESEIESTDDNKIDIHDSLIHPFLIKNDVPLVKPSTPLPSLDLLAKPAMQQAEINYLELDAMARLIEKSLSDFRIKARVVNYLSGPVITLFEIELAPGVKAARISILARDLARSLSMPSVRVVEIIPGKPYIGIEIPNRNREMVYFREVLNSSQFKEANSPLTVVLGKDISGETVVADIAKTPHLLVAGTTGSGKSVGVNAMILSILYKSQPEDVRFIMIDPKMLELSVYEGIPHLLSEVVTDMKDATNALNWCVNEMERRYRLMSALGVRNLAGYNEKIKLAEEMGRPIPDPLWKSTDSTDLQIPTLEKLPYIVVIVDEFADLIMAVGKKIEELIARLAQKARAAGMHLVLATQRPSVDVITGLIKANIPTRIAFTVSSKIDSRTILDQMGAESLLGMGDMLYLAPNSSIPIRVHGAFVRDDEVHAVVQDWKARGKPKYENVTANNNESEIESFGNQELLDPLFDQAVEFVVEKRRASISSVQRQFRVGYNRAARIIEEMELQGIVSPPTHNGNREVLAPPVHDDY